MRLGELLPDSGRFDQATLSGSNQPRKSGPEPTLLIDWTRPAARDTGFSRYVRDRSPLVDALAQAGVYQPESTGHSHAPPNHPA